MKKLIFILIMSMMIVGMAWGQTSEEITPKRSSVAGFPDWTDNDVDGDKYIKLLKNTSYTITPSMNFSLYNNIKLNFKARTYGTITEGEHVIYVSISSDGGTQWSILGTRTPVNSSMAAMLEFTLEGDYTASNQVKIKFSVGGSDDGKGVGIQEIAITGEPSGPPLLVSPLSLSDFSYIHNDGPSTAKSFIVSGTDLNNDISITAPTNYEISTSEGSGYGPSILLTQSDGTVDETTIYVRLKAGLAVNSYNEEITINSAGAVEKTVTLSGSVTTPPAPATPVALQASNIGKTSFVADWQEAERASGYYLDVICGEKRTLIDEGFESSASLPNNWTGNAYVQKNSTNAHNGTNYSGLNAKDKYFCTPKLNNPTTIKFWAKKSSSSATFTVVVEYSSDESNWTNLKELTTADDLTIEYQEFTISAELEGEYYIRWYMTSRSGGSIYIDDILITFECGSYKVILSDYNVGNNTSYEVEDLDPGTVHQYKVRAYDSYGQISAYSNEIQVRTLNHNFNEEDFEDGDNIISIGATDEGDGYADIIKVDSLDPEVYPLNSGFHPTLLTIATLYGQGPWEVTILSEDDWCAYFQNGKWNEFANLSGVGFEFVITRSGRGYDVPIILGNGDKPTLPVELSSFTAIVNRDNKAQINWVTQTETGVSGFYIYRNECSQFATATLISPLIPAHNGSTGQRYSFIDEDLQTTGEYYYWLQTVDMDGSLNLAGPLFLFYDAEGTPSADAPLLTKLNSVYPNPFNPSTTIDFSLKEDARVRLAIYNLKGQLVRQLLDEERNADSYQIVWDGKNDKGQNMSSGVYLLNMQAGKHNEFRRIMMMK